jgi:hypothetical protein
MLDEESNGAALDFLEQFDVRAREGADTGLCGRNGGSVSEGFDGHADHGDERNEQQAQEHPADFSLCGKYLGPLNFSQECR